MGKRIFLIIGIMLTIVVLGYLIYAWYDYSHEKVINLEDLSEIDFEGKDLSNPKDLSEILEYAKQEAINDGRANPRIKIFYQDEEVAWMDHLGNIGGLGNMTMNGTDAGYGFFDYLGTQASSITKGWFSAITASGDVITGNISMSGTNFSMGGCSEYWNGTCSIKSCPTTITITC